MRSVLVIGFFPAFRPAASGGEQRLYGVYEALSHHLNVTLLTSTDFGARFEEVNHSPSFREYRVPKGEFWRTAYAQLEAGDLHGDLAGLAFALAVSEPDCPLRVLARKLAPDADVVIHEFPYSEPIFADGCPVPEIYNSHNFELSLLSAIIRGEGFEAALLKLYRLEGNLVARAQRVFATSAEDGEKFRLFYGVPPERLGICANGYDEAELNAVAQGRARRKPVPGARPRLLFTGSGHHPNVEAARFLLTLADQLKECDIVLAGGVCGALAGTTLPGNVISFGPFSPAQKDDLLIAADLYLNPVILGSGTSLKALDALGGAVPMVATPEGVRGLGVTPGGEASVVAREGFVAAVRAALADRPATQARALVGQVLARKNFSWTHIAARLHADLSKPVADAAPVPVVLAFNDYRVSQVGSGGIARIRNLLGHLHTDIVLLSFAESCHVTLINPGVLHVTVPKTSAHHALDAALAEGQPVSVNDATAALFAGGNRVLGEFVGALTPRAGAVIFEHPYMAPVLDLIDRQRSDLAVVYSAHNVEATHKPAIMQGHSVIRTLTQFIRDLEAQLVRRANLVVCCTKADVRHFSRQGAQALLVPNGCEIPIGKLRARKDGAVRVGFLGSSHGPNVEAAEFIVKVLAPAFPEVTFELIGSVGEALGGVLPDNLVRHGLVSEAAKSEIMANWRLALNPVESGGGSSLKLPDFMVHGLATLNTVAGARGFDVKGQGAGLVTERSGFVSELARLLADPALLATQGANARAYAERDLTWEAVTRPYRDQLHTLLRPAVPRPSRRVLVVTYRYTEPVLGGAEEYLVEVLKRLRPACARLDLAAINVGHLTNHHHFGCGVGAHAAGSAGRLAELFDQTRVFPAEEPDERALFALCRKLEANWAEEEFTLLAPFASKAAEGQRLRLFGGFYSPEKHDNVVQRWTSRLFSFLLPADAKVFRMSGYAAMEKRLSLKLVEIQPDGAHDEVDEVSLQTDNRCDVSLALPPTTQARPRLLVCTVETHEVDTDHRSFGIMLDHVSVLTGASDRTAAKGVQPLAVKLADLGELLDEQLSASDVEGWIASLCATALRRDAQIEADFAAARGPHSPLLQAWLAEHAADYDTVLVQGIPFDVIPRTVETLAALPNRPRLVTLPHFHGDDRFYHWRRYYEAFDAADKTLLFSEILRPYLGQEQKFAVVPGGGVRADEQADPMALQQFRHVYGRTTPFFLVLGRKTGSKGYDQVLRAHQALRASHGEVDLVMIGPDEDGLAIHQDGFTYLGRQPRAVVRGALMQCLGLINMSRSESFGIVLCEAWLFGKPVIANRNCYAFRGLVREGETGLLVGTDAELTTAMARLADDAGLRAKMGQVGFAELADKYTWERVAAAVLAEL